MESTSAGDLWRAGDFGSMDVIDRAFADFGSEDQTVDAAIPSGLQPAMPGLMP